LYFLFQMAAMSKARNFFIAVLLFIAVGLCVPQKIIIPVESATSNSYNKESFWYYPWGKSGTHKGVDIFAKEGTNVFSATSGIVINAGSNKEGGNTIHILGPKWRLHYYAHLKEVKILNFSWVNCGDIIGTVGTTGNAIGKEPHLHYTIKTLIPYLWRIDNSPQGWKKIFYLNPIDYLNTDGAGL
jgi:peptidoglycan LD-endopeptidase LytH